MQLPVHRSVNDSENYFGQQMEQTSNGSLEISKSSKKGNCPNTWAVKAAILFLPWPHSLLFPLVPLPFLRRELIRRLFTLSNYGLWASWPSPPSQKLFSSQALFLTSSMAEHGSRNCQVDRGSVGCRGERVSRRAVSTSITSDSFQF